MCTNPNMKTIEVTQADIDSSSAEIARIKDLGWVPLYSAVCPIATALRRQGFPNAIVGGQLIYLSGSSDSDYIPLNADCRAFARNFDTYKPVAPFSFEVPYSLAEALLEVVR